MKDNPPNRAAVAAEQAEVRQQLHVRFTHTEKDARVHYRPAGTWPDCGKCGQSCTAVYNGKVTCNRCSSSRRLNA